MSMITIENTNILFEDTTDNQFYSIEIIDGEFSGIIFKLGKIEFPDDPDDCRVSFEYSIDNPDILTEQFDKSEFEQELGKYVNEILLKAVEDFNDGVEDHGLVFRGGL